ncbi:MAG: Calx-beta domain-containing protein, partial [Pseudomonadota bacterium]
MILSISGGVVLEGSSNLDNLVIYTATLSEASLDPVSFTYRARSGTADEDTDFDVTASVITIPAGLTTFDFSVRTLADNVSEADESVLIDVFNVDGATLANGEDRTTVQGVILDDDGTGLKRAAFVNDAIIVEGDSGTKQAVFEIRLSQPSTE